MDLATFTAEAERLTRPCRILRDKGDGFPFGYWHGVDDTGLCLSVQHRDRWLNIHIDDVNGHVKVVDKPHLSNIALFAERSNSLPPIDAVFLFGSDAIAQFLEQHDWPRDEPFNDNFPDPTPSAYERTWQDGCSIYQSDVVAVCGGWHFPWPDGDWPEFVDHELVAWTIRDAEPWIEVLHKDDTYLVKQRIT